MVNTGLKNIWDQKERFTACIMALFLPMLPIVSVVSIFFLFFFLIIYNRGYQSLRHLKSNRPALLISFIYLLYVAGTAYSSNVEYAIHDLRSKLPLFVLPWMIPFLLPGKRDKAAICVAFSLGVFLLCLFLIAKSLAHFSQTGNISVFFYDGLTGKIHPTYFSMYVNLALIILLELYSGNLNLNMKIPASVFAGLYLLGSLSIIIAYSKMGIITFFISIILYFVFKWQAKKNYIWRHWLLILLPVILFAIVNYVFREQNRFQYIKQYVEAKDKSVDEGSLPSRLKIWESSHHLIMDNFFMGVGTGDVKEELHNTYVRDKLNYPLRRNLNAHNQYLQTFIAVGIMGFLVLLFMMPVFLVKAARKKDILQLTFIFIAAFNFLAESILEREAGILWFSLFFSVLCCVPEDGQGGLDEIRTGEHPDL